MFEFWVSGFGFRLSGLGFRFSGLGLRISGLSFQVSGLGVRVSEVFGLRAAPVPAAGPWPRTWTTLRSSIASPASSLRAHRARPVSGRWM